MQELRDRVAVVTGAASGIGRAMATRFAAEGMRVVLADIERDALAVAAKEIEAGGGTVLAVPTDTSKDEEVERLAARTLEAFDAVHVICNNAGVAGTAAPTWQRSLTDWQWVLGVNLWGVIHGIRAFVPRMLAQGTEGHVVNTASMAGLITGPGTSDYGVTKHAVVALSESLHHELAIMGARVRVSVLCPAWVNTRILDSDRNRPAGFERAPDAYDSLLEGVGPTREQFEAIVRHLVSTGLAPEAVAASVVDAIRAERFYILTHPEWRAHVRTRLETILEDRNPVFEPIF
jgi:NAD(P)-dependent dehydrogenase (short-subunit alcohol dehydrogenase family)